MPSTKASVPLTGPRAEETTNNELSFTALLRTWFHGSVKDRIRVTNYNPNNAMEQYAFVDYVQPYAYDDEREAKREQNLKPGILRIQDRADNVVSTRKRLLGRNIKYADLRKEHTSYGKDEALRRQLRYDALKDTSAAQGALQSGLLALENGSVTTSSSSGVDSKFDQEGSQIQTSWLNVHGSRPTRNHDATTLSRIFASS